MAFERIGAGKSFGLGIFTFVFGAFLSALNAFVAHFPYFWVIMLGYYALVWFFLIRGRGSTLWWLCGLFIIWLLALILLFVVGVAFVIGFLLGSGGL